MNGYICSPHVYTFEGWTFEIRPIGPPWPLKDNGDPRKKAGWKFYDAVERFSLLPRSERETCRIGGGCRGFTC